MAFLGRYVSNFVKSTVMTISPNKVDEYTMEQYNKDYRNYEVVQNIDNSVLYKIANHFDMMYIPQEVQSEKERKAYSIFRMQGTRDQAVASFTRLSDVIGRLGNSPMPSGLRKDKNWLEKITGVCRTNPNWNAAHVAAFLGYQEVFRSPIVADLVNEADKETGLTPLHVAVNTGSLELVKEILLLRQTDVDRLDALGNSVFHLASALDSPNILNILIGKTSCDKLAILNNAGRSPIHFACEARSLVCLETLLKAGADPMFIGVAEFPIQVAVRVGSIECVDLLLKYCPSTLNVQDPINANSPLHLATTRPMVDRLCELDAKRDVRNMEGLTPLHWMIRQNQAELVLALLMNHADPNVADNDDGTPLQSAVIEGDIDTIRALIVFEADVNAVNRFGDSARHLLCKNKNNKYSSSKAKDVILYTLHAVGGARCPANKSQCTDACKFGGSFNGTPPSPVLETLDASKELFEESISNSVVTAAMQSRLRRDLDNSSLPETDELISGDSSATQTTFYSDTLYPPGSTEVDGAGVEMDEVATAQAQSGLCQPHKPGSGEATTYGRSRSNPRLSVVSSSPIVDGMRVLSLDGGGIRGLLIIQMLRGLERAAASKESTGGAEPKQLRDMFDWITGTSTGGLLALCIANGKSIRDCRRLYLTLKDTVFVGKRPYSSEAFEEIIKREFGEETKMTDISTPKVTVTSLLCDRFPPKLHLFRNYRPPLEETHEFLFCSEGHQQPLNKLSRRDSVGPAPSTGTHAPDACYPPLLPPHEQLLWRVARATGAAPTFFRACGRFLDGGLIANNPTVDILTEIHEYNTVRKLKNEKVTPIGLVLSLGTGCIPVTPINQIDVFRPNNPVEMVKSALGITSLGKILIEMATMSEGRVVDRSRAWCHSLGIPFFRFSPPISADIPLDTTDNKVILQVLWETEAYLFRCTDRLNMLASLLV